MIAIDSNSLIQAAISAHPLHLRTAELIASLSQREVLVIPEIAVTEFLHIVTDSKRFTDPLSMPEALAWMEKMLLHPSVKLIASNPESISLMMKWMKQYGLGRKRIIDTFIAAIVRTEGVTRLMTSNRGDFQIFGVFEIVSP